MPDASPPTDPPGIPPEEQPRCAICRRPKAEHGRYIGTCLPGFGTYSKNSRFTLERTS